MHSSVGVFLYPKSTCDNVIVSCVFDKVKVYCRQWTADYKSSFLNVIFYQRVRFLTFRQILHFHLILVEFHAAESCSHQRHCSYGCVPQIRFSGAPENNRSFCSGYCFFCLNFPHYFWSSKCSQTEGSWFVVLF